MDVLESPTQLFVEPSASDRAARTTTPDAPRPMGPDPDAPYGYMIDPKTKQARPRKTAGRQVPGGKQVPAPKARPANKPRTAPAPPAAGEPALSPVAPASHAEQVAGLVDGLWMLAAAIPMTDGNLLGMNVRPVLVRAKAQAEILQQQKQSFSQGLGMMADHVPVVARGVEFMAREDGPAWWLPAMMLIVPFVMQTSEMWRAPIAEIEGLAATTDAKWNAVAQGQQAAINAAKAEQARQSKEAARFPGEEPLPFPSAA